MKIKELLETSTSGSTSSGSVASVATPIGANADIIRRMPPGQSFFGITEVEPDDDDIDTNKTVNPVKT